MTWIDLFLIGGLLLSAWGGLSRGTIKEFFEFLIVTLNPILCSHLYFYLSGLLNQYAGTPHPFAGFLGFIFFFVFIAMGFWVLAGRIELAMNIPPSNIFHRMGGGIFASFKWIIIAWVMVFALGQVPLSESALSFMRGSPSVSVVSSLSGPVDEVFKTAGSYQFHNWVHRKIEDSRL